mmetsp:Transcript_32807/g.64104  ORF Transcript_32807/g.64104 Transcript_32807/m.64104 type:complete len:261 (-) Transcript_32807:1788-2570(-)
MLDRKLDGIHGRARAEVVAPRLEALLPRVKVHRGQLAHVGRRQEQVERLALVDEGASVCRHVDQHLLLDLPRRLVKLPDLRGDLLDALDAPLGRQHAVLHVRGPQVELDEVLEQVRVDDGEVPRHDPPAVQVAGVRLKALVVPHDLRRRRCRHRRHQQAVAEPVAHDIPLQRRPVPPRRWRDPPQVELQVALAGRRTLEGGVGAVLGRERVRGPAGAVVDGLEDLAVERARRLAVEGHPKQLEDVSEALHPDPDGAVAQV